MVLICPFFFFFLFRSQHLQRSPTATLPPFILSHPSSSPFSPSSSSPASKIESLRSKVDLLKLPLVLSPRSISERKSQLAGVGEPRGTGGGGGARKARPPPSRDMDNESQYSGYSYKSSHSRSSRKHRWVRTGHPGSRTYCLQLEKSDLKKPKISNEVLRTVPPSWSGG